VVLVALCSVILGGRMNSALPVLIIIGGRMNSARSVSIYVIGRMNSALQGETLYFFRLSRINMAFELVLPTCLSSLSNSFVAATSSPNFI